MKVMLLRAAGRLVLPTMILVFVIAFEPGHTNLALRIYALVVAAYAVGAAIAALRRELPPTTPLRPRASKRTREDPPETLERLEQEVILGISGAFDLHYHLRPRVRGLARDLLAGRRGISLDDDPEAARLAVGEEAWDLVQPDRPPPADRLARGIAPNELSNIVTALEGI
jgi:hypothetical protein